ncbi:MAG: SIMPL domain-containing protein [Propionibacteriaceae bacterium]|jgi:uncharacterized protein YggE|nr:SIMPL domain-containing protein [Propionibacteriaceae bacterium]
MSTEIIVRGQARDLRAPDRAIIHLDVNKRGRDRARIHTEVAAAVTELVAATKTLAKENEGALVETSVAQASQRSWKDKSGQMFTESVSVRLTFADFAVMSRFLFDVVSDVVQLSYVEWALSAEARDIVRSILGAEAVRDAQARADIFAKAADLTIVSVQSLADPGLLGRDEDAQYAARDRGMMPRGLAKAGVGMGDTGAGYDLTPEDIETETQVEARFLAE